MVVGRRQVWAVWRMRQDFPAHFFNFLLGDFCDMRPSVVVEEFCRRRIHTLTSQRLVHPVQLALVEVHRNCLNRIQNLKVDQAFTVPPNTKHHLFSVDVRFWSFTGVQPLPLSCCVVVLDPLLIRRNNGVKKPTVLGAVSENSGDYDACRLVCVG